MVSFRLWYSRDMAEKIIQGLREAVEYAKQMRRDDALWCVCWAGTIWHEDGTVDISFRSYKSPDAVSREEAERRIAWGRRRSPEIVYWLEPA